MTGAEQGLLLLCCHLGDPGRKVLTVAQLRNLFLRVASVPKSADDRALTCEDVVALGYDRENAKRIVELLSCQEQLAWYLQKGRRENCVPITRASAAYPPVLRQRLGLDCPGCLWAKGELSLLEKPAVALVGSRELAPNNRIFAREVGIQAARQGYVLVSGNANGADKTAQQAALQAGGSVISVVADSLDIHKPTENTLYISEDSFDMPFSPQRAISRNRIIHALAQRTFVAQCTYGKGGTWDGATRNLRNHYSPLFCFADDSEGANALLSMGANGASLEELSDFSALSTETLSFFGDRDENA